MSNVFFWVRLRAPKLALGVAFLKGETQYFYNIILKITGA